jgi:hypothetical protein
MQSEERRYYITGFPVFYANSYTKHQTLRKETKMYLPHRPLLADVYDTQFGNRNLHPPTQSMLRSEPTG